MLVDRRALLRRLFAVASWSWAPVAVRSFSGPAPGGQAAPVVSSAPVDNLASNVVAYKGFSMPMEEFGVQVPLACWFPAKEAAAEGSSSAAGKTTASYPYRISVRRIGQLLAGWDFIPGLVARDFDLEPARAGITNGIDCSLPDSGPVILLAHGYLGSRFDLSHLAEALAAEGFTCVSAEYPESLAASYDRVEGLDRAVINDQLLKFLETDLNLVHEDTSMGIIGHSLGCGTVLSTGDDSWARVCIAGFPRRRDGTVVPGNVLFVSSMNDGAVSPARFGGAQAYPNDISMVAEDAAIANDKRLPPRSAVLYDRPDAPNHISFLTESVNDAMIDFLSALLPVARAFEIPVLDFDRYQVSRDSRQTAEIVHPLVVRYMKQQMSM